MEEEPTGKNLFEQIRDINPKRNAVFHAIDCLETPERMRQFFNYYTARIKVDPEEDPKLIAGRDLGFGHRVCTVIYK